MVLQLRRGDRDAVEEQAEINSLGGIRVERELPRHGEPVRVVMRDQLGGDAEGGLAIGEADFNVLVANSVTQNIHRAALVDLLSQPLNEPLPSKTFLTTVRLDELAPLWTLRQLDEGEEFNGV